MKNNLDHGDTYVVFKANVSIGKTNWEIILTGVLSFDKSNESKQLSEGILCKQNKMIIWVGWIFVLQE